ncbi:MAG: response regulator [Alphaproteobacteria bacterium]|nr:response regulator [Alphaproteobacteria bacterium]MCD8570359.1 response regulator [Alphaproteobacteria bacterium]
MRVLIVDRDELSSKMLTTKLLELGCDVVEQTSKNDALEMITKDHFDVLMIDPAPLTSPRPVILNIRRNIKNYPYIFLMGEDISLEEAIKSGTNDILHKPLDIAALPQKMESAGLLSSLVRQIGDDSEDFPSAGGVIAKSAFNQLFLSALDRADRYGETSYVIFIAMENFTEIQGMDGAYAAEYALAKLSQFLVRLRRQSDIIGQTGKAQYALLLQRPVYETEPEEAAARFAEALQGADDITSSAAGQVNISLNLIELPTGRVVKTYSFP